MENSVRKSGVITALFGLLIALFMSSAPAQATVPPSQCHNGTLLGAAVVICEIDINDDGVLNGNDIKVIIPVSGVLSGNKLVLLASALDNLTIDVSHIDIDVLTNAVVNVINGDVNITGPLVVLPCGCS
jgi:hypothetical protein